MLGNKALKSTLLVSMLSLASVVFSAHSNAAQTFVTTQDGSPLVIAPELFDTPAAKEFLATGKNIYVGNAEAQARGHDGRHFWRAAGTPLS